jgi:hypothetical protein
VPDPKRVYTDDEVRAILSRAIDRQRAAAPEGLSHDDLLAVARDAGISPEAVEAAATELATTRAAADDEQAIRRERASDFRIHLFTYIPVIAFLVVVNLMTTSYLWFLWPALGWGLALALHARFALFPTEHEISEDAARRTAKRRRAEEKARRKAARSDLKEGAKELGHAVERGVAVLLSETAKRIHEELDAPVPPGPEPRHVRVRSVEPRVDGDDDSDEGEDPRQERQRR